MGHAERHREHGVVFLGFVLFASTPREHPALLRAIKLSLRTLELDCYDYRSSANPPILHRKETFVPEDYPAREMFAALTREEEEHGLLTDTARIGTRQGWESRLNEARVRIEGHRVVRIPDADAAPREDDEGQNAE